MTTLEQGQPAIWWRIVVLLFASVGLLLSLWLGGLATAFAGTIFVLAIGILAQTKRFRWWGVAGITVGTLVVAAAILMAAGAAFIIKATDVQ
jgi:riboflavin transporter FmnP